MAPPKVFLSFLLEDKTSAPDFNFNGCDARYTTSHALLCRSIVWSLLCYCVGVRDRTSRIPIHLVYGMTLYSYWPVSLVNNVTGCLICQLQSRDAIGCEEPKLCFFYILSIMMSYFVVIWRCFNAEAENIRKWADGGTNWYTHIPNKLKGFYCKPKEK